MLLNTRDLQLMNAFESLTHARALDCFEAEDTLVFLVKKGEVGKAIGKGGETIAKVRKKLGKRIAVFEDSDKPREFVISTCQGIKNVSPDISKDAVRIDLPRRERENISGRQIRLIKELIKRKLGVEKVDFVFI